MSRLVAIALLLAAPVAGHAQDSEAASPPAAPGQTNPEPAADPEIVVEREKPARVCETRQETGSIIPRRVCRTPEQVAADEEKARLLKEQLSRDQEAEDFNRVSRNNRP